MWLDSTRPGLRAQGGSDLEEDSVWPVMSHSFPQEIDLLSPEPLLTPISSLGPSRADTPTLAAALRSATDSVQPQDPVKEAASTPIGELAPAANRRKLRKLRPADKQEQKPPARAARRLDPKRQAPKQQAQRPPRDDSAPAEQQRLFD
jgi:hypothetical protein